MKMTFKFSNGRKCWKFAKGVRERKKKWANVDVSRDGTEWMENLLGYPPDSNCWKPFSREIAKKYTRDISISQVKAKAVRDFLVIEVLSIENFAWVCVWVSFGPRASLSRQWQLK